jgi:hypothetical protein
LCVSHFEGLIGTVRIFKKKKKKKKKRRRRKKKDAVLLAGLLGSVRFRTDMSL